MCLSTMGSLLMWPEAKKDSHPTSQIKAVIVTLTATKANERQIGYRNKHFGDTGGATLHWECGHRPWVTQSPLGRPSTGRNLGTGQGACCSLVLKTNLGPVIHKSHVYHRLETLLCALYQSRLIKITHDLQSDHWTRSGRLFLVSDHLEKGPESYINVTLLFYFCPC